MYSGMFVDGNMQERKHTHSGLLLFLESDFSKYKS